MNSPDWSTINSQEKSISGSRGNIGLQVTESSLKQESITGDG